MRHLALTLSIIGAILIAAASISFFASTHVVTQGIRALFITGGIAMGLGLISFIGYFAAAGRRRHRQHISH